ncbi:MAG: glutathione S-transferase N-terminal domain-containing protein [Myxococcales bacterium]|nr:glutathione S-transferase N-terminal domain-containing protein [Myxococcales bacterium]
MGFFDHLSSASVSLTRLGRGSIVWHHPAHPPARPLLLFESETCPFCRKVREVLSEMDLEYVSYPTARGSQHREKLKELGGKKLFPFLMDPNTGRRIYEAEEIITYLCEQYGRGRSLTSHLQAPFQTMNALFSSYLRQKGASVRRGLERRPLPNEYLVLYQYEGSASCRQVREVLHELDLPCWIKNVARGSMRRAELLRVSGKIEVPYLLDTNTDTALFGAESITRYLLENYGPYAATAHSAA